MEQKDFIGEVMSHIGEYEDLQDFYSENGEKQKGVLNTDNIAIIVQLHLLIQEFRKLNKWLEEMAGHEICMGVRHGIFGKNAKDDDRLDEITAYTTPM